MDIVLLILLLVLVVFLIFILKNKKTSNIIKFEVFVVREGFEPSKLAQQIYSLPSLAT